MSALSSDRVVAAGRVIGFAVDPDAAVVAAAMLGELPGAWPAVPAIMVATTPGSDRWGAVAQTIDTAPTADAAGVLAGKSLAVKDNIAVAGVPTALGSGLPGFVGDVDATVVARAEAAGARVIAKAQCEAFLLGANSFTSRPRPVRNPHDPARSAGGSSSGSAAMLAAGLVDLAIGTDSGGSIRIPASYCGVVGFMPTRGRIPYTGIAPLEPFLERVGPMARSVADAAALFGVLDGSDGIDPRCGWRIANGPGDFVRSIAGLKLGVLPEVQRLCEPEVARAFDETSSRLRAAGALTTKLDWHGMSEAGALHTAIYVVGEASIASGAMPGFAASQPRGWAEWRASLSQEDLPPLVALSQAAGLALHRSDPGLQARATARGLELAETLDRALDSVDALMLPVGASLPAVVPVDPESADSELLYGDTRLTAPFNVTGHPAISLPSGRVGNLPFGLQLVARRGNDEHLLAIAAAVEATLGRALTPDLRKNP